MGNVLAFKKSNNSERNMTKGFASIHRKMIDLPFYKDSQAIHLWVHIILKANHEPASIITNVGEVVLGRGQLITGRKALESETGIPADRVKYLLNKFEKLCMIERLSNKHFTKITVVKYDEYQSNFVPSKCHQSANAMPAIPTASATVVPSKCHQSATNNNIYNNSNTNVLESPSSSDDKPAKQVIKKSEFSCEDVLKVFTEELPEAKNIRVLSEKRRNKIRTFWKKANPISRQLDNKPFTLDSWRAYLKYISSNCRWMLEDREDSRTGKIWHKKGLEYFLDAELYLQVREGEKDDR